jgi:hypothetical protein
VQGCIRMTRIRICRHLSSPGYLDSRVKKITVSIVFSCNPVSHPQRLLLGEARGVKPTSYIYRIV